ncbi:hypothetical protein J2T04_001888 [Chryseobacterium lathyri]|uniref:Uncharacterized protein n=1 Tax=Chryseobacterium lathyri TaxID=395933 RepID=A0ABT9SMF8_9FLAO|nr:hypothetical protein [Chryseobacterium lathyri]MDQ0064436.1 hypothetical protein [Chryseobacterium lathyri]
MLKIAPIVPPIKVAPKSVLSGILLLCLIESLLSQPKIMKVIKFIINRMYIIIIGKNNELNGGFEYLSHLVFVF